MINIRRSAERGHFNHGWLDTYHTFSFGDYHDREFMNFRSLRVINEDVVQPGNGFSEHPHRDMEILTYVLSGALEHRDSLGNGRVIRPGEVQYMAAGKGVLHSEFNPSDKEPVHLIQIWIVPNKKGLPPHYEQREFPQISNDGKFTLLASSDSREGSIKINQDALIFAAKLQEGQTAEYKITSGRGVWLQVLRGSLNIEQETLNAGDGVSMVEQPSLSISAIKPSEVLLFDLQ